MSASLARMVEEDHRFPAGRSAAPDSQFVTRISNAQACREWQRDRSLSGVETTRRDPAWKVGRALARFVVGDTGPSYARLTRNRQASQSAVSTRHGAAYIPSVEFGHSVVVARENYWVTMDHRASFDSAGVQDRHGLDGVCRCGIAARLWEIVKAVPERNPIWVSLRDKPCFMGSIRMTKICRSRKLKTNTQKSTASVQLAQEDAVEQSSRSSR